MSSPRSTQLPSRRRRQLIAVGFGAGASVWLRPAQATADEMMAAVKAFTGGALPQPGRIHLDVAPLVENGNTVPITITVASPMTAADHVQRIAVFNELNPQREVIALSLTPAMGRAQVSTRIRLATTQKLIAVASLSDGTHWSETVDVVVTLAACIE